MDRSRRQGARASAPPAPAPPRASRLTVRTKTNNRRKAPTTPLWQRLPKPMVVVDACGRALRRSLPALAALAVLGAISGTAWAGYRFVTHSPRFAIDQIVLRGNHHLTDDEVHALLPIHVGDNVFETGLDAVVRELQANPWIERADAHRVLPHTVVIEVREHEPVAVAELGGPYLVDRSGHPFKRAVDRDGDSLPLITGLDRTAYLADPEATAKLIVGALGALDQWRAGDRPAIAELHLDPHGALELHAGATAIELGGPITEPGELISTGGIDAGLAARIRTFDAAWSALSDDERTRARAIHLDTRTDHVTVAFNAKDQ
jgi:cell division protein FtsQ